MSAARTRRFKQDRVSKSRARGSRSDEDQVGICVRWRQLSGSALEAEQAARDVAETVLGELQRRLDAPRLAAPAGPRLRAEGGTSTTGQTAQTAQPLTYTLDEERVVGWHWGEREGAVQLITESGRLIDGKTVVRVDGRSRLNGMNGAKDELDRDQVDKEASPTRRPTTRRQPAKVHVRPGSGGRRRADPFEKIVDPTEGLAAYGELIPQGASGGASILLLELDPGGNAVILCRLSSEEEQEQFLLQLDPCLALAKRFPEELRPRYALFALNMSGTRTVRPDRAGPPPPGELERDNMLIVERWLNEGWLEQIIARGGDRLAREMLPGETLLARWQKAGVGLWLARHGRRMDYRADRLALRAEMMVSAEERAWITSRMGAAQIEKGPLAGNGWLGSAPFGFNYNRKTRSRSHDPEQWPFILRAFELADSGECLDGEGLSTRKVTERLAAEGCPFDHDRLRTLLGNIVYATGEYVTNVRGIPIPQTPIPLENPVPLDRFLRVQDLLALRQGRTDRTPLGEYLFNYVPFKHERCAGAHSGKEERPVLIKGYVLNKRGMLNSRRYRHSPTVPDCCKEGGLGQGGAFTWDRDVLERAVVTEIRKLAEHPEVLRQLALAERHSLVDSPSQRLNPEQRAEIERELDELEIKQDAAADRWVADQSKPDAPTLDEYQRLMKSFRRKVEALERQLQRDDELREGEALSPDQARPSRVTTFLEIMTLETPDDPRLKALRARLFQRIVSEMELAEEDDGGIVITLHGHLVPGGVSLEACDPIAASADLLDSYALTKAGGTPDAEREVARVERLCSETDLDDLASKSVSNLYPDLFSIPGHWVREAIKRQTLDHTGWRTRRSRPPAGTPAWTLKVRLSRGAVR